MNTGPESRRIFWIDQQGKRKFYKELGPHASIPQPTFAGHVWLVAREDDRCQTIVIAVPKPMIVDVTRSCLVGRINDNGKCVGQDLVVMAGFIPAMTTDRFSETSIALQDHVSSPADRSGFSISCR